MNYSDFKKIPDQEGKIAIITGANIGLGYETAKALASKKMNIILACRNLKKAEDARDSILDNVPGSIVNCMQLDLSNLASVRTFGESFNTEYNQLDLLINNAGIMAVPKKLSEDGHEMQWATNHLGHFLLTGLLLDTLKKTKSSRIVTLSSLAHKNGQINFEDLNFDEKYERFKAYGQSKLANLVFSYELDRRLKANNIGVKAIAAHPGISRSNLINHFPLPLRILSSIISPFFLQSAKMGALPTLYAALNEELRGGEYIGPVKNKERSGPAGIVDSTELSKDVNLGKQLWEVSQDQCGFSYLS